MIGQTVIITTHYIEEARNADNVGFMSAGTVLKQSQPQRLLEEYRCDTLEEVFLSICLQTRKERRASRLSTTFKEETNASKMSESNAINSIVKSGTSLMALKGDDLMVDFIRIKAMIWKYYILTKRQPLFLMLFYAIPLLAIAAMKVAVGRNPINTPIAVYNADIDPKLSQQFLDLLDKRYTVLHAFTTNQSAYDSVVRGKNAISVVFPQNYSDDFWLRFSDLFQMTDEELDNSIIKLYADMSNPAIGYFVIKEIITGFSKLLEELSPKVGSDLSRYLSFLYVEESVYGDFQFDLSVHFAAGILLGIAQVLPMVLSAIQIVNDRKNTSFERVLTAGVKPIEYFIAHFIQNFLLILTEVVITMFCAFYVFENTQIGSYFEVYIILFLQGIIGMGIGLLFALLLRDEVSVAVSYLKSNYYIYLFIY